jgi:serine/threonine-protein kinase
MTPAPTNDEYLSPWSLPGAMIDEKYRVDGVIGRGGVGVVVAATHMAIAQRVAIKMIRDDVPMQHELLDRFHREACAAAMIRSEHVARVMDVGRLPTGRPYIVMEYLEGEDLEQVIARGAIPSPFAVDLALQTCEALAEAHRAGIIHRDLKPANLFLTRRTDGAPLIKVLDFGISKIQPLTAARFGRGVETTAIMGSPGYMAPEQMKSTRNVDARADVWSVGAVLYEMLVGRPAFEGATMLEILNAIATCSPVPASQRQVGVPAELDLVLGRCLTAEPEQRFGDIAQLAVALQPFASPASAGLAERAVQISREALPPVDEQQFAAFRSEPRPSSLTVVTARNRRSPWRKLVAIGVGAVCVVGLIAGTRVWQASTSPLPDSFAGAPAVAPTSSVPLSAEALPVITPISPHVLEFPLDIADATAAAPLASAPPVTATSPVARPSTRKAPRPPAPSSPFGDRK